MSSGSDQRTFSRSMASTAVILTLIAGYVDAIGYLSLGHVYVANMSGNSVAIGIHAAASDSSEVWKYVWPVVSFAVGLFLSRLVVGWGLSAHWRSVAAPAIIIQVSALLGFIAIPNGRTGVFFAGCAMGIQAATLSRFNGVTVYTCFVTGSLVKFAEHGADVLLSLSNGKGPNDLQLRWTAWFALIWIAYVSGAYLGATMLYRTEQLAVMAAIATLVIVALADLKWPAAIEQSVRSG